MILRDLLKQLEILGTEQNRKIYRRHGAHEPLFGVSFANLNKLKKQIKTNHLLALELWDTKNYDAMIFATMIADPTKTNDELLEKWVGQLNSSPITGLFSDYVIQTNFALGKAQVWIKSKNELISRTGWNLLTRLALKKDIKFPINFFENYLVIIEEKIHQSVNMIRSAMNNALIAIGRRDKKLQQLALAAAKRIGKVEVDHGETNCKTPNAVEYILKIQK